MPKGVIPSPNIWRYPAVYEVENQVFDPDGLVEAAIRSHCDWAGRTVLDLGCGTGFHLPRFAEDAERVFGVEPNPDLVAAARARVRAHPHIDVRQGTAQTIPIPSASVDFVHARWAYFFGPGCEPGLAELRRVVRRHGAAFVIDTDPTTSTWGRWFAHANPSVKAADVEEFWARQGWQRDRVLTEFRFTSAQQLADVVRIEFAPRSADAAIAEGHQGPVDVAINLWWVEF